MQLLQALSGCRLRKKEATGGAEENGDESTAE
jgi:hypothetical protein